MADERYKKFLGIEPADDVPNYYELFDIARDEQDVSVIEKAYKTQIRKLQEIRTSKDKGFIEFLKEELRSAKRILLKPEKRKEYDESLIATALEAFRGFAGSLMVMGHINKTLYDTMIQRGVADGLTQAQAEQAVQDLAKEHGATLETEESAPAPAAEPASDYEDPNSGYEDAGYGDYGEGGYDDSGYGEYGGYETPDYGDEPTYDQGYGDEPTYDQGYGDFADDAEPAFAGDADTARPPSGETVLQAPPRGDRPPPPPVHAHRAAEDFVEEQEPQVEERQGPWWRGVGERPPPWGRRTGSEFQVVKAPTRKPGQAAAPRSKELDDAIRFYNLGAALAKVASDVHEKLRLYYPPGQPANKAINGVPAQKVLDTEQSTYRECLKKFQTAMDKVASSDDGDADMVRVRSNQSVSLVRGILDEIKAHKLRLMGGLPQQEETRAWQEFVGRSRPSRLTRVID